MALFNCSLVLSKLGAQLQLSTVQNLHHLADALASSPHSSPGRRRARPAMLCCLSSGPGGMNSAPNSARFPRSPELSGSLSTAKDNSSTERPATDGSEEPILISEVRGANNPCRGPCWGLFLESVPPERSLLDVQVAVTGVDGELKRIAESKLSIKPNFAYTLSEVRDDIQRVFDAGYFKELTPVAEDTRDGIKLTLQVLQGFTLSSLSQPSCVSQPRVPGSC